MTKFTPGMWANKFNALSHSIEDENGSLIAVVFHERMHANAALIAAAPEMYADEDMLRNELDPMIAPNLHAALQTDEDMLRNELDSLFHVLEQVACGVKITSAELERRRDRVIEALERSRKTMQKARGEE